MDLCAGILLLHHWHAGHTGHPKGSRSWGQYCYPSGCRSHLDVQRYAYPLPSHMHTVTVVYVLYRWCWNGEQDLVCLATGVRVFMVYSHFILHVAMAPAGWTWTAMLRDGGKKYSCKNYPPNV